MSNSKKLLSLQTVALALGISYITAYRLVNSGQIHAVRIGAKWKVTQEEVDRLIAFGTLNKDVLDR
jgi:excisionase family DNA binding protein